MRNLRVRIFALLAGCHLALFAASVLLWDALSGDIWRDFWTTIWAASLLPALWTGYNLGLPVVQPIDSGIFLPDLEPNAAGFVLCIAFWCTLYAAISRFAPAALRALTRFHHRSPALPAKP